MMNFQKRCYLAEIFQSGMMLQREKEIRLWGNTIPDTIVTATLYRKEAGGCGKPILSGESRADKDGQFRIVLPPQNAGKGYRLTVTFDPATAEPVHLENICFGDLWLAGGQSNMEFFLKYDRDWEATKKLPRNPDIRMYNVPQRAFEGHASHNRAGYGYWFDDSDPGLEYFSAPAYSFARHVQAAIGVPIGIIGCNWGGSTASAWVDEEVLDVPPLDRYLQEYADAVSGIPPEKLAADSLAAWRFEDSKEHGSDFEPLLYGRDRDWQLSYMEQHKNDPVIPMGPWNHNRPSGLYHTMLSSLFPLPIKGVLWYQGESDAGDHAFLYDRLLAALIENWRRKWRDDLPFLIVQLAPFGMWLDCDNQGYAVVREKQAAVARTVPHVYMAGIMDLGSYYDIHPKEKMEVGRRLSLLARGHIYGEKELLCNPPEAVVAFWLNPRQIAVVFRYAEGLDAGGGNSDWNLRIQERDIIPAETEINAENGHVILTLPAPVLDVSSPAYVSLGFGDYAEIHIRNRAGLSALPFRIKIEKGELS